jgi:HEAT repeat protein
MMRAALESGGVTPAEALVALTRTLEEGAPRAKRVEAYQLLGDLAGRAFDTTWEVAEKAAWVLLGAARDVDSPGESRELVNAIGRGFRNFWLLPFVHARLADEDAEIVEAAISAAGGLGFPALEAAVVRPFVDADMPRPVRLAAIRALGRTGAVSAAGRLAEVVIEEDPGLVAAALTALTEIRSPAAVDAVLAVLAGSPAREVTVAGVRYVAEMGRDEVLPFLRRFGRSEDPELRMAAAQGARAWKAESRRDAGERLLVALTEKDRVVRGLLARRLRLLPIADVLAEAEVLLADDAASVVQVVGELRTPETTHFLVAIAKDSGRPSLVRARAAGAVEADEPWEREALAELAADETMDEAVRVAAAQALGAFASLDEMLHRLKPLASSASAALRGAFLWALQLAARPVSLGEVQRQAVEKALRTALADPDPFVRRRAAYVAGNLRLRALGDELVALAKDAEDSPDLRIAAFVALEELGPGEAAGAVAALFRREEDSTALVPASRAVLQATLHARTRPDLAHLAGKLDKLLADADPRRREAAVRVAGLAGTAIAPARLLALAEEAPPRVREEALAALGRLVAAGVISDVPPILDALGGALADPDEGVRDRAAEALLGVGGEGALGLLLGFVASESSAISRASVAQRLYVPNELHGALRPIVDRTLDAVPSDDPAWEPLCRLKLALTTETPVGVPARPPIAVDDAIAELFPMWRQLSQVSGFAPLARSLRTAEALYGTTVGIANADPSPPIILWMKTLEGYVHAWLSRKLGQKQNELLWNHVAELAGPIWPRYSRWVAERWTERVDVGGLVVEVPLRAVPNALRELLERRQKRLDSPLSVTEWARLLVLLGVDHPSGAKNTLGIPSKQPEQVVRVAHRLAVLAAVRNAVTHRTAPPAATVDAFRKSYYGGFEELTALA